MGKRMAFLIATGVVKNHTCDDNISKDQEALLMPTYNRPKTPQQENYCCWGEYLYFRQVLYDLIFN